MIALFQHRAALALLLCGSAFAADPTPPDQREVWVPTNRLHEILAKHPNAVVLSREQHETLVRDAAPDGKPAPALPRQAALMSANYHAHLAGKVASVTADFTVNVLTDEWAQVPLAMEGVTLGAVSVDGDASLQVPPPDADPAKCGPPSLLMRGRGEHRVSVELTAPVSGEAGFNALRIKLPAAGASAFEISLPPNQTVVSQRPVRVKKTDTATIVNVGVSAANPALELTWRGAGDAAQSLAAGVTASGLYTIDAEKVRIEFGYAVETRLGSVPAAFQIAVPVGAKVLQVVADELAKWEVADGRLAIALQPRDRALVNFWIVLEAPSLAGETIAILALPIPRIDGLARMQGVVSIAANEGVAVKGVTLDETTMHAVEATGAAVTSYRFTAAPAEPRVVVEKSRPRFSADLDTLVQFQREAIFVERTLTLHREQGDVFQLAFALPAGEELLTVRNADDSEPDWRVEDGKVRVRWSTADAGNAARVFKIRTRSEPEQWTQLGTDGATFTLGDAKIDDAEKVTGYIALKADDAFRLEAAPSETLERRDGRTTPVQGDYAWFRRQEFSLAVKVAKRPGEVLASVIGYALPIEGVLDLNGEIDFQLLHSGARSVRVKVPEALAQSFHFDGPQIAERNLSGDIWTIVFQKELSGRYALKFTAQVPVQTITPDAKADTAGEKESRFNIDVPLVSTPDAVRASGVWSVEANTETEIAFDTKGMNELDSLLAPKLADYQPRHRVIGVFAWLGQSYALKLSGVRHAAASVLASVVDRLDLDTVISTSGMERNQATLQLRTAGAQYLDVQLPAGSRLLSLTVEGDLVKPVGDRADQVRVQLPAKRDATAAVAVSLLYETPKSEWSRTGSYATRAPQFAKEIPVLRSQWRLFLPEGFEYTGMESNLRVPDFTSEPPLLASVVRNSPEAIAGLWSEFAPTNYIREMASKSAARPSILPLGIDGVVRADPGGPGDFDQGISKHMDGTITGPATDNVSWDRAIPGSDDETSPMTAKVRAKLDRIVIPQLNFRDAKIREAIDFLKKKSVELDSDPEPARRGVGIVLKLDGPVATQPNIPGLEKVPNDTPAVPADGNPNDARITVSLTNIPLSEALKYVTGLSNLKYKIGPHGVVIVPLSANTGELLTKEYKLRPDFFGLAAGVNKAGRFNAKDFLLASGVTFPQGAAATYFSDTASLILRNTQENLDLMDTLIPAGVGSPTPSSNDWSDLAYQQRVSGLLPMKLELPKVGRVVVLDGLSAAERVEFRYDDWWTRARRLWLWSVAGGVACLFAARDRPWWRTCWAALVLTFLPLCVSAAWMPVCNALLGGWLLSVVLQRVAVRCVFAVKRKEAFA